MTNITQQDIPSECVDYGMVCEIIKDKDTILVVVLFKPKMVYYVNNK